MNRLLTVVTLIILVYSFSSCQQPVGNLDSSGNSSGGFAEDFWLFSLKTYYTNDTSQNILYRRSDHIKIIGVGEQVGINDSRVIIELMTDPVFIGPSVYQVLAPGSNFKFTIPGDYILRGSFNGLTDEHHFEVFGTPVEPGEGSTSVGMGWLP